MNCTRKGKTGRKKPELAMSVVMEPFCIFIFGSYPIQWEDGVLSFISIYDTPETPIGTSPEVKYRTVPTKITVSRE